MYQKKVTASASRYYSVRKQQNWHCIEDRRDRHSCKIGQGYKVNPEDYSHTNPTTIIIP